MDPPLLSSDWLELGGYARRIEIQLTLRQSADRKSPKRMIRGSTCRVWSMWRRSTSAGDGARCCCCCCCCCCGSFRVISINWPLVSTSASPLTGSLCRLFTCRKMKMQTHSTSTTMVKSTNDFARNSRRHRIMFVRWLHFNQSSQNTDSSNPTSRTTTGGRHRPETVWRPVVTLQ